MSDSKCTVCPVCQQAKVHADWCSEVVRSAYPRQPALRQRNSAERKGEPIHSGVLLYFPDALAAIARWSLIGNVKHNGPDAPLGWSREKSDDHMDCVIRHSLTPNHTDDGEAEGVAMAWRALAALQLAEERRLAAKGIMPYSGIVPTEPR